MDVCVCVFALTQIKHQHRSQDTNLLQGCLYSSAVLFGLLLKQIKAPLVYCIAQTITKHTHKSVRCDKKRRRAARANIERRKKKSCNQQI
jgi:hypothetical protein